MDSMTIVRMGVIHVIKVGSVVLYYRADPAKEGGELVPREPVPADVVRVYNTGQGMQADLILKGVGGQAQNAMGKGLHAYKGGVFPKDLAQANGEGRWFEPLED